MADPPSYFFKFIRPGHKFNLSIPRSFWTKLNRGRCEKATLRRGCHEWAVVISEEGVFRDGWRKFVRDNGVQEFDFIVFKHQGNMLFDFMVFDQSSCERQYPCLYEEMDVEQPLTESDSIYTHKRRKKLKKRKKTVYSSQNEDKFGVDDDRCFVTIMTPNYIKEHIPMNFARLNGLIMQSTLTQIVIIDEAQRSWPATLEMGRTHIRLRGLRKLIIKNYLELGDMCMFKLVENGEVTIFNVYHLGKKPIENFINVKKETSSAPKSNPYFISTLKPCTFVDSRLYLLVKFSRPNGLKIGEMILRDDKNRSWKVQLNKNRNGHFWLGSGLRSFCNENGLRAGDEYKFELVKNEKDKPPVVNFSYLGKKPVTKLIQAKKEPSSTLNNYPYFMSTLKPYFKKSGLYLPAEFSSSNGLKVGEMVLNDDKGRSWKVQLNKNGVNTLSLGDGFGAFSVENGLKEGDAFKFEIIENEKDKPPVANFSLNCEDVPPCFIARVKSYNIEKSILNLPNKFAEENGLIYKEEMILRNVKDERPWTVKLERSITNSCYLGRGWKDFHVARLEKRRSFQLELVENGEKPIANFYLEEIRQSFHSG